MALNVIFTISCETDRLQQRHLVEKGFMVEVEAIVCEH